MTNHGTTTRYSTVVVFLLRVLLIGLIQQTNAKELTIATWNMGWHLSNTEADHWIGECNSNFSENDLGIWQKSSYGQTIGWKLPWGRNAPIEWNIRVTPPCDVYRNGDEVISVSLASYKKRADRLAKFIEERLTADVIAFQEVSGEQSIKDILAKQGLDYKVCSYRGHSIQKLAFAWSKKLRADASCTVYEPLALSGMNSLRPGLKLTLKFDKDTISFLNVHLKSSCVTFLESLDSNGKGQLSGTDQACVILQQQIKPLKNWLDKTLENENKLVLLGDFNRNLWHEYYALKDKFVWSEEKANNLWQEINDGKNQSQSLRLLDEQCNITAEAKLLCEESKKRVLTKKERNYLSSSSVLGCRNSVGVDHIVVAPNVKIKDSVEILSINGEDTSTIVDKEKDKALPLSDHCPHRAKVVF